MSPARVRGGSTPIRRAARGSISRTTCGSLRVRVYAGTDPITRRQRWLSQNIPAGPTALEQAEAACRRLLSLVHHRRHPRVDVTLAELLDRHLTLLHASETTRRSYRWTVSKHVGPMLGHLRLTAVTPELLDVFYAELLRCRDHCHHPHDGHECRPLGPATVRKIHYVISGAYRRAVRWGWIDRSPTRDAEPPSKPHPEPQPPTPAEAARILDAAWADPDLGPLVWLAMITGARRGELCALRWRHVDLEREVLVVRASIAQNGADMWEKDTKLHQRRHLTLDPDTVAVLTAYRQTRQHRAATVGVALSDGSFVFSPQADGARWRPPATLTRQYHRLVTSLEIRSTLHKLRHYSATELIAAGVDLRTVAGRLGHSDGGTTLAYYTAWVREADQRASLALRNRLPTPHIPPTATPHPIPDHPVPTKSSPRNSAPPSTPGPSRLALPCPPSSNLPVLTTSRPAPLTAPSPCLLTTTS